MAAPVHSNERLLAVHSSRFFSLPPSLTPFPLFPSNIHHHAAAPPHRRHRSLHPRPRSRLRRSRSPRVCASTLILRIRVDVIDDYCRSLFRSFVWFYILNGSLRLWKCLHYSPSPSIRIPNLSKPHSRTPFFDHSRRIFFCNNCSPYHFYCRCNSLWYRQCSCSPCLCVYFLSFLPLVFFLSPK